jgi:hypothetical protein
MTAAGKRAAAKVWNDLRTGRINTSTFCYRMAAVNRKYDPPKIEYDPSGDFTHAYGDE